MGRELVTPRAVADPPGLPPLTPSMPLPLVWTPVSSAFIAPARPELVTATWRERDAKHHDVLNAAPRELERVRAAARDHHDQMVFASSTALQAMALGYDATRSRIESTFLRADEEISLAFGRAQQTLRDGARSADRLILDNYLAARDALSSAAARMKKAIKHNADSAGTQTDDIVARLGKAFVAPLSDADAKCTEEAARTEAAVMHWQDAAPKRYPLEVELKTAVRNEAKHATAERAADTALEQIAGQSKRISGQFQTGIKQISADIRARIGPSLKAHADKIEPEGTAAVDQAFGAAFALLQRNANDARAVTVRTHEQVLRQLDELRRVERMRLERERNVAVMAVHDEATAAASLLRETTQSTLPRYADAVERLHRSMTESATKGPHALEAVTAAGPEVIRTLDRARDAQRLQIESVHAGVTRGLAAQESRAREDNLGSVATAVRHCRASATATADDMLEVAAAMTAGLSALSHGVVAAAEQWVRPLADAFKTFLTEVDTDLRHGFPAFIGRVDKSKSDFLSWLAPQLEPDALFQDALESAANGAQAKVTRIKHDTARALDSGIFDKVDETALGNALRPLTRIQGLYLRSIWPTDWPSQFDHPLARATYRYMTGGDAYTLDGHLLLALGPGSREYNAAISYLNGRTAEGARAELEASINWYNDQEERIEGIMRGLSPSQLEQLHDLPGYDATRRKVRNNLDGTDLKVFDALDTGNQFQADAYRMIDELNAAREREDKDATNEVLAKYSRAPTYGDGTISAEQRRTGVQVEFARIRGIDLAAKSAELSRQRDDEAARQKAAAPAPAVSPSTGTALPGRNAQPGQAPASLADRWMIGAVAEPDAVVGPDGTPPAVSPHEAAAHALLEYATRDIRVWRSTGERGGSYSVTATFEGRDRDLARALIFHGEGSPEARAAQLGVEAQRPGGPDILKVDAALVDPRLGPDWPASDASARAEVRRRALEDRKRTLEIYARDYGGVQPGSKVDPASVLIKQMELAFGSDEAGASLAAMLVRDDYPTPETASYALQYAMDGAGTNNELIDRTLGRMNRDEIAAMRQAYRGRTGRDLYADMGVFGHGWFGDLSGDDRLRAERMLLGVPRNDKERAEVAAFTIRQQREETGLIGGWLASGSLQDILLTQEETSLDTLIGGPIRFGPDGTPQWTDTSAFRNNAFLGHAGDFASSITGAELAAQNYSAKVDQYANAMAMGIAVVGAIVAAVVTVATGGAASPLLLAAIAGITGLAAMGAQRLIKGGRYGWEDAVTDLGMTAVSALTAGVGQALALASRGGVAAVQAASKAGMSLTAARQVALKPGLLGQMGRMTGSAYLDKVLIGASTGGLGSLGQAALNEHTYKGGRGIENLFGATMRGVIGGGVTAGVTNAIEDAPLGRLSRFVGGKANLGDAIGESTNAITRGLGKATTSSLGAAAGRASELTFDARRNKQRIDAGDIFVAAAEAGGTSFLQSFGEGAAEAKAQAIQNARLGRAQGAVEPPITRQPAPSLTARAPPAAEAAPAPLPTPEARIPARGGVEAPNVVPVRGAKAPADERGLPSRTATDEELAEVAHAEAPLLVRGAAAAIPGSAMHLGDTEVTMKPTALEDAVDRAVAAVGALSDAKVEAEGRAARVVDMKRADDAALRVRILLGDTGSSDVASFRAGTQEEGVDFVITLSSRADPDLHARAVAHELAELRVHGMEAQVGAVDLLANRAPSGPNAKLSAHDVGRLAELEVLSVELEAQRALSGAESPAAKRLENEIDALAAHLGILHSEEGDRRFVAATEALGDSPGWRALGDARARATREDAGEALRPARAIDESSRLTAADRRRLAEVEELGARMEAAHGDVGGRRGEWKSFNPNLQRLERDAVDLLSRMGLLTPDAQSDQRAQLAFSALDPSSPGTRLIAQMRRSASEPTGNDALRPGLTPDERTVPSRQDVLNAEALQAALRALVTAEQRNADPVEIARLRHAAEARAAVMGLVHGERAADRRVEFLLTHAAIPQSVRLDGVLAARLTAIRQTAAQSPLLRPRSGTLADLPLLSQQVLEAQAMGDFQRAASLTEIAGFRLEAAGAFAESAEIRNAARDEVERLLSGDPAARALVDDALARHGERLNALALRRQADSVRGSIVDLEEQVTKALAPKASKSRRPASPIDIDDTRQNIELLKQALVRLEAAAGAAERVAFRPQGRTADDARAAVDGSAGFPTHPQFRTDPDYPGSRDQQALTRQLFGDSPLFQSWERFKQVYADVNATIRIGGLLTSDRMGELAMLERVFGRWLPGRYVSHDAPLGRFLPDSPLIRAVSGEEVAFQDAATGTPVRLSPDDPVSVESRQMTVTEAEAERRRLINDRNVLDAKRTASNDATERATLKKQVHDLIARINAVSEGLGEAAGMRFAATLPGGLAHVTVDRGKGVPDIIHVDPTTGHVTVIECKGGTSELGSRNVSETLGRAARAEQTTPEYLRDLAIEMTGPGKSTASQQAGQAILDALNATPPKIDAFVVRQPLDGHSNRGSIEVTHYPVTRSGR